jgi:hypothetical protein
MRAADYDIDTIEGRCHRHRRGDSWYATEEEIISAIDSESVYARYVDELNHRQWWRDLFARLTLPIRWPIFRLLERVWPRKASGVLLDDEIPF